MRTEGFARLIQRSRRPSAVLIAVSALAVACSGCSSSGSAETSDAATTIPKTVPAGTTLRVGDQLEYLQTILSASGEDRAIPYKVKWAGFIGGPPMLQAFHAGAIDAGFVASTPLIFAQAAHQDVVAIAGWVTAHGGQELVAAPGSGINSWADLKGKNVAFQKGTSAEATVLKGLHGVNLSLGDIKAVDLPITQISAAFQGGSVDAGILVAPLDTAYLKSNPGAKVVDRPSDLAARASFLIADKSALEKPATAAALRDFIVRFGKALLAIKANPDQFVEKFYVAKYGMTLAAGKALLAQSGATAMIPLSGDLIPAQQELADLYHAAGEIPEKLDVAQEFDNRYAGAIREVSAK
jgi:sulfonate transport system substrate-binding protein